MEQVDIDQERQREISALETTIEKGNLFDVLGVPAGAPVDEVRKAFHELSRKFHPDRYYGKKLGSYAGRLDRIFKKLSEASQTLSDPKRREAYLAANPFVRAAVRKSEQAGRVTTGSNPAYVPRPKTPEEEKRDAERRARLTRHPYLMKAHNVQGHLAKAREHMAKGEYAHAFTNLNLASQSDPNNTEVKALLVEVRQKNDALRSDEDYKRGLRLLEESNDDGALNAFKAAVNANASNASAARKAAEILERRGADAREVSSYMQKAVEADPKNVEYRVKLGELYNQAGMRALAKKQFEEAARLDPEVKKRGKRLWPF